MAQSVTSLRRTSLVAIGGKADIGRSCCLLWSDANDPSETWPGSNLSQRKSIVRASLKRDILPALHGMTPNRRVTWQATSDGENSWPGSAARPVWPLAARAQHRVFQVIGCSAAVRLFWSTRSGVK